MKLKYLFFVLCTALLLTGCSISVFPEDEFEDTWADSGSVKMGRHLTIQNTGNRLTLSDNRDLLSAEGLYYASWTMGTSEPYVNSDGDTVDLYDAQLYFLLGEYPNETEAQNNRDKWADAGEVNYEVLKKEEITCNGQSYCLITYNCISEDNPYDRGVSAFGTFHDNAMCVELTCREYFDEDLKALLTDFLSGCTYSE